MALIGSLASGTVTTSSIADSAITRSKLVGTAVPGMIPLGTYTIGSSTSYYNIDNIFSSTYSQYTIYYNGLTYAAQGYPFLKLIDSSGSTISSQIYWTKPQSLDEGDTVFTAGGLNGTTSAKTQWWMMYRYPYYTGNTFSGFFTIQNPYQSLNTSMHGFALMPTTAQVQYGLIQGHINNTTSYRGLAFSQDSGNITGGTITVYAHYAA